MGGLTEQQWQSIKTIINRNARNDTIEKLSGKAIFTSWIMDTSASHRLIGRFNVLKNIRDMAPVLIVMADGREQVSLKEGTVYLGVDLVMKSVYYVEELISDLISVGQLMDENKCVVQMADNFLVVQDHISRIVIGAGKQVRGTFQFRSMEIAASVTLKEENSYELWLRSGGLSFCESCEVSAWCFFICFFVFFNKACDVCLRTKKTRDCFPISINKTSKNF